MQLCVWDVGGGEGSVDIWLENNTRYAILNYGDYATLQKRIIGKTHTHMDRQTDAGKSAPYVPLGDTNKWDGQL